MNEYMPELPEVETIVSGLKVKIVNKSIVSFDFEKSFANKIEPSPAAVKRAVVGNKIKAISRRGKMIIVELADNQWLLIHLKMTGQLVYATPAGLTAAAGGHPIVNADHSPNKFTRATFSFKNGASLYFNDVRKFGYIKLVDSAMVKKEIAKFGIEPIEAAWTRDYFDQACRRFPKQKIKNLLLKQEVIAGLGNIYADETCFWGGVRPTRLVKTLKPAERRLLWLAARRVLLQGIKFGGTTFSDFVNCEGRQGGFQRKLMVYGRAGQLCRQCQKEIITKIKIGGRSSCYCRRCQS